MMSDPFDMSYLGESFVHTTPGLLMDCYNTQADQNPFVMTDADDVQSFIADEDAAMMTYNNSTLNISNQTSPMAMDVSVPSPRECATDFSWSAMPLAPHSEALPYVDFSEASTVTEGGKCSPLMPSASSGDLSHDMANSIETQPCEIDYSPISSSTQPAKMDLPPPLSLSPSEGGNHVFPDMANNTQASAAKCHHSDCSDAGCHQYVHLVDELRKVRQENTRLRTQLSITPVLSRKRPREESEILPPKRSKVYRPRGRCPACRIMGRSGPDRSCDEHRSGRQEKFWSAWTQEAPFPRSALSVFPGKYMRVLLDREKDLLLFVDAEAETDFLATTQGNLKLEHLDQCKANVSFTQCTNGGANHSQRCLVFDVDGFSGVFCPHCVRTESMKANK